MNVNAESHFAVAPADVDFKRSQFDRSHSNKLTFNVGELVPFYISEVLPGDTFDVSTNKVVRLQTLLAPVMDNLYLDTYYFFVPNRLVWEHWQNFCGESNQAWTPSVEYTIPQIKSPLNQGFAGWKFGSLADYLGVPPCDDSVNFETNQSFSVNALPFRAYAKICDDWFRDQNLQDPLLIPTGDATVQGSDTGEVCYGGSLFKANKYHDYFTSCLPAPQRGPVVSVPMSGAIPVIAYGRSWDNTTLRQTEAGLRWKNLASGEEIGSVSGGTWLMDSGTPRWFAGASSAPTGASSVVPSNLTAFSFGSDSSDSLHVDVSTLRFAFQLQRFLERLARGGSRYVEIIKSMFGVTSPDARLQRSEYLGGNRIPINIHEVTNNAQSENSFLGNLGAFSHTTDAHGDFIKSFVEHGYVIGVCVARYDHSYPQGLDRLWTRSSRESFYWPVFAHLSEQAVYKDEIMFSPSSRKSVFGYQEAWAEYRYSPNRVACEMRPNHPQSLASWNFADDYEVQPTLSEGWLAEDKAPIDRTLAVTSKVSNQILLDVYIQDHTSRVMPTYSVPGLIDHN